MSLAILFHLYAGFSFINVSAPTYDEPVHLSSGYSYLLDKKYRMNIMDHPPFSEMISAVPLLIEKPNAFLNHFYYIYRMPYHYGDLFLYHNRIDAEKMLNLSRKWTLCIWTLLFGFFIFVFARKIHSIEAGFFSVIIFCLTPAFISNNSLITTDSAPAIFYLAAFFSGFLFSQVTVVQKPVKKGKFMLMEKNPLHLKWAFLSGIATGLAMASKFSMFILPPLIMILWIFYNIYNPKMTFKRLLWLCIVFLLSIFLVLLLVYKFDIGLYFDGLQATIKRLDKGRSSFIMGQYSIKGVWWYFPFAFLVKNPEFVIFLFACGIIFCARYFKKEYVWLIFPFVFYFAISLFSKVQIGFRHLMPVMPFAVIFAGIGLAEILKKRILIITVSLLFLIFLKTLIQTHPYYLSYFNEFAGGPDNGYKLLVDSNLDWGQDVKTLSKYLKENGNPPIIFSYFGVARPEYYGIKYVVVKGGLANIELEGTNEDICDMDRILFAVSATNLQGTYHPDKKTFDWLKKETPVFIAGNSIFLYDLTGNKEGREKLREIFERLSMKKESECLKQRIEIK